MKLSLFVELDSRNEEVYSFGGTRQSQQ